MTMTKRLPAALKKKLQGSLESLSAKEAGRLYVIYAHEADRKDIDLADYRPAKELTEALNARVLRSRGKPDEAQAVYRYNGFVLLERLFGEINYESGFAILTAFALEVVQVRLKLLLLLQEDVTTEAIRTIRDNYVEQPKPVSLEDFDWLMRWSRNEALYGLADAASFIDQEDDTEGDAEDKTAAYNAAYDALVEKLQAGELVGGEGIFDNELATWILIEDGTIPAWAALRMVWRPYVGAQGYRIYDRADYADFAPEMVDRVAGEKGVALDGDVLRKLAADFYKLCRGRPWGKKLPATVDPDVLVQLLTQSANPFLRRNAPDLGRVNWVAFQKNELDHTGEPFEAEPVATIASLNRLDSDFRRGFDFDDDFWQEQYYPSHKPQIARAERARLFAMMARLDTTRQPFSYDRKEEGMMTISELMGIKFLTLFEREVEDLRRLRDHFASIKEALRIISDRYFGGLPILLQNMSTPLGYTEEALQSATDILGLWVKDLAVYPWEIDVSDLRIGEPEIDQDFVDELVDKFVGLARKRSRINEPEDLLFREEGHR